MAGGGEASVLVEDHGNAVSTWCCRPILCGPHQTGFAAQPSHGKALLGRPPNPWHSQPVMLDCHRDDIEQRSCANTYGAEMRRFATYFMLVVFTLVIAGCQEKGKEEVPEKGKQAEAEKKAEGEAKPEADKAAPDGATDVAPAEKPTDAGAAAEKPTDVAPVAAKPDAPVKPSAVEQKEDKGREIVARAVEAMGGKELLQKRCHSFTMKTKGVFYGMPYVMESAWKHPDKMLMELEGGSMTMGYNGKECWNRFHTIVRDCQPEELVSYPETLWSFQVNELYPLLEEGIELEYVGEGTVAEQAVDKVTVNSKDAPMVITLAFDKATGLLAQSSYEGNFSGKKGLVTVDIQEYKDLDGMKIMARNGMTMDGKEIMSDEYVSAVWEEVPDEKFARPAQAEFGVAVLRQAHEMTVVSTIHKGSYETLGRTIGMTFGWLGMNGIAPWGPPTMGFIKDPMSAEKPEDYETEILIPVMASEKKPESETIKFKQLPARQIAVRVEQGPPDQVAKAYPELAKWIGEQGLVVAGPASMTTFDDPRVVAPEKLIHELFFIVEKPAAESAPEAAPAAAKEPAS